MNKIVLGIVAGLMSLGSVSGFSAQAAGRAEIRAKASVDIYVDSSGKLKAATLSSSRPTIKDFEDGAETYDSFCYSGEKSEVKKILETLVGKADGDGDSYAELVSIKSDSSGVFTVKAKITDERGESVNSYAFEPCKN